eukprot:403375178
MQSQDRALQNYVKNQSQWEKQKHAFSKRCNRSQDELLMSTTDQFREIKKESYDIFEQATSIPDRLGTNYWQLTLRQPNDQIDDEKVVCFQKIHKNSELQSIRVEKKINDDKYFKLRRSTNISQNDESQIKNIKVNCNEETRTRTMPQLKVINLNYEDLTEQDSSQDIVAQDGQQSSQFKNLKDVDKQDIKRLLKRNCLFQQDVEKSRNQLQSELVFKSLPLHIVSKPKLNEELKHFTTYFKQRRESEKQEQARKQNQLQRKQSVRNTLGSTTPSKNTTKLNLLQIQSDSSFRKGTANNSKGKKVLINLTPQSKKQATTQQNSFNKKSSNPFSKEEHLDDSYPDMDPQEMEIIELNYDNKAFY